ncbi:amidohydrolase family protein [Kutzneria buriramensis]|uniref:Imidazolonepropionase-like amidohydrolase n=1 Tax=Kutzneria buriramensis TaxID=1045776 RepID=A0A3E0I5E9_9PSEU|nr:amidohydrolase family protein [Kutzneria buriramensis]REH53867.1 imidazolonepropionase-like amidohydrolase [Kutzneria buriramensis]
MRTALSNVRVFDGQGLTEPRTVVIDGPTIGDDATGATELDGGGATLLPGLIDAHLHLAGPETLDELAKWGVTTGLDMGFWPPELIKSMRGSTGTADFRTAGLPAIGPDGMHAKVLQLPAEAIVQTPDEARRLVGQRVAEGVDYIKGVAEADGDGGPSRENIQALVDAAHEHGLKTVLHAATLGAYELAVGTGTDFVTHIPRDGVIQPEVIAAMRAAGQIDVPTVSIFESMIGLQDHLLATVAALHDAGIEVLAGTDAHNVPGVPAEVRHGESLHHELELLVRAGLTPVEALRAATVRPAEAFGLADRGVVEPGRRADLLLVDGDPTTDITVTRKIKAVWCAGERVRG